MRTVGTGRDPAMPDAMVDAINVIGDTALVRDTISAYRQAGVEVPVIFPLTWGDAGRETLEARGSPDGVSGG